MAATQSGISELQRQEGMTSWSNAGDGKTNLKSKVWLEDKDGNEISVNQHTPMPVWDYAPEGSVIKYEIETISDGVGKSDRVSIGISYSNDGAIVREYQGIKNGLSDEDREALDNGSQVMADRVLKLTEQAIIDKSIPFTVMIFNQIITTDKNGKSTGSIPIQPTWPNAGYSMVIHYGYAGDVESRTDSQEMWENIGNAALEIVIIGLYFVPGAGWVAGAARASAIVIEVAAITYSVAKVALWTGFGPATENKYGVSFPDMGFTHAYGFGTSVPLAEESSFGGLTPTFDNPIILIGSGILGLLILRRIL